MNTHLEHPPDLPTKITIGRAGIAALINVNRNHVDGLRAPGAGPSASTAKFLSVEIDVVREVQRPTFTFTFRDSPLSATWVGHPRRPKRAP